MASMTENTAPTTPVDPTDPAVVDATFAPAPKKETPKKEDRFVALDTETAKWIAKHARPAESACLCGCGGLTKSRFLPGHDALLKERLRATLGLRKGQPAGTAAAQTAASAAAAAFGWELS